MKFQNLHTYLLGDKNYKLQVYASVLVLRITQQVKFVRKTDEQNERSSEWKRDGSRIRVNIDNPQPSGPRILVGKGWIFISFWSGGAFLVGRIFNCACVGDE